MKTITTLSLILFSLVEPSPSRAEGTVDVSQAWNPFRQDIEAFQGLPFDEQINELIKSLRRELDSPTQPHRGFGGGMVTHEYQLEQIEKGLLNVLAAPNASGKRTVRESAVDHLRKCSQNEARTDVRSHLENVMKTFDQLQDKE